MFKDYCASCHGVDGRGNGPAVVFLKTPPPDLRMIAQRNNGKFPSMQVKGTLTFGLGTHADSDLDMPTWGPAFRTLNGKYPNGMDDLRIVNLTNFIESFQDK